MIVELTRDQWSGGPVQAGHVVPHAQFVGLVEHHTVIVLPDYDHDGITAGDVDDAIVYMQALKRARPDLGPDVPYSFVIFEGATEDDCIVAHGRSWGRTGAHTIGYNSTRYGCAWAGDFTDRAPTPGMYEGLRWVGRQLADPDAARPTLQHRDVYATACPGNASPSPSLAQPPFTTQSEELDVYAPAIENDACGNEWVFARGRDGHLWAKVYDKDHKLVIDWHDLGGQLTSGVTAKLMNDGRLQVLGRGGGPAFSVWARTLTADCKTWEPWYDYGGET